MLNYIVKLLVGILLPKLDDATIKKGLDAFFDTIENAVEKSSTTLDDVTVLPLIKVLRKSLNVPDND